MFFFQNHFSGGHLSQLFLSGVVISQVFFHKGVFQECFFSQLFFSGVVIYQKDLFHEWLHHEYFFEVWLIFKICSISGLVLPEGFFPGVGFSQVSFRGVVFLLFIFIRYIS